MGQNYASVAEKAVLSREHFPFPPRPLCFSVGVALGRQRRHRQSPRVDLLVLTALHLHSEVARRANCKLFIFATILTNYTLDFFVIAPKNIFVNLFQFPMLKLKPASYRNSKGILLRNHV